MKDCQDERVRHAADILGIIWERLLDPIGPEARLRLLNAMLKERGVQGEFPYICEHTGRPTRAAEEYHEHLKVLIDHAKREKDQPMTKSE